MADMRKFIDSVQLNESVDASVDENIDENIELAEAAKFDGTRFLDIKEEIKELVKEALSMVKQSAATNNQAYDRARSYWYPHILMALDDDHGYMGQSTTSMESTYEELKGSGDDEYLAGAADELNRLIDDAGMDIEDAVEQVVNDYGVDRDDLNNYMNG